MVKATLRSAVLLGLVSLGMLVTSMPSFAEVQNVKVGGDITVRAFHRENLDLHAETGGTGAAPGGGTAPNPGALDDEDDFIMSTVGVNVGADLTENVSAFIRLANERNWNATTSTAEGDFDLSEAYITLKELFYSPLTVRVGQQPIVWGRGFVLGSNLLPGVLNAGGDDRNASISANEYTDFTAFDAIRATLDLSGFTGNMPLTADYVYIKADEQQVGEDDDTTIQGVNFSTSFDESSTEMEAYYLNVNDESSTGTEPSEDGALSTIGFRGSAQPVDGSYVYGEVAYQWGTVPTDPSGTRARSSHQSAWAANLGAEYLFADMASTPKLGSEWRFYSGKDNQGSASTGWTPIAPGYFRTALREFQTHSAVTGFYPTAQAVTSGQTNQHELALYGGFNPIEDLEVGSRLSVFIAPVGIITPNGGDRNSHLGTEWDTQLTYNYTDDVQFGLLYALFKPGSAFRDAGNAAAAGATPLGGRNTAQQLVSTVSLKF